MNVKVQVFGVEATLAVDAEIVLRPGTAQSKTVVIDTELAFIGGQPVLRLLHLNEAKRAIDTREATPRPHPTQVLTISQR